MSEGRTGFRARRVAELIQAELSPILIREFQDDVSGFITVTGVEVSADLQSAEVRLSLLGSADEAGFLERLERRKGSIRKALASRVRLKYNPELIFVLDRTPEFQDRIDRILEGTRKK